MALFPQIGPTYFDEKHKGVLERMEYFYSESISINQSFWSEADTDTRFNAGDQSVWNDIYGNLPANRRRQFQFNRIRRVVNMIDGYQRRNRKSIQVIPVEKGDEQTADQYTKLIMKTCDNEQILETFSNAVHGAIVTGMNLLHVYMDYREDPVNGSLKVDNCNYNTFMIDPFFEKTDLSDCNAIWKRSYLTKQQCISLMPDAAEEIMALPAADNNRDGKFQFMPQNYNYGTKTLLSYDEFYYRDYRKQKVLVDTETGETLEWKSSDEDGLKEFVQFYPQVTIVDREVPTVRMAIVIQGKVFYDGGNPLGTDSYPFIPVLGYYEPQLPYFPWRIQGVVRGLRDAQYLYNRRKVIELDILESQVNSGFIYKENALVNPKDVFLTGQGRGIAIKSEASIADVQPIQAAAIPPSIMALSESLAKEVMEISGVNEELIGSAVDDKAGILSMLRQGAGLTTLQSLFDQWDQSLKLLGSLMLETIQANWTPGKVKRMLNQEPTDQFYNKAFGIYDASIAEGFNTTTQKQMQFAQLLQLRETGVPVPDDVLLNAATLQDKQELVQAVQQNAQQQQQMQQQQQQVEMQEMQARTELAQARAMADQGLGIERISRVEENQALAGERKAEAEKDHMAGLLDFVKAMKEIEKIDLDQIQQLVALSKMIREDEDEEATLGNRVQAAGLNSIR